MDLFYKAILNVVWVKHILSKPEFEECIKVLAESKEVPVPDVDQVVKEINSKIEPIGFDLRRALSEDDENIYWVLCNSKADDLSLSATPYTPEEIVFFKNILQEIISHADEVEENVIHMGISKLTASNLRLQDNMTMTASHSNIIIDRLIQEMWLHKTEDGYISLGLRATIDLKSYIKTNYGDEVHECASCTNLVTKGERCDNEVCNTRFHKQCSKRRYQSQTHRKCPTCNTDWHISW